MTAELLPIDYPAWLETLKSRIAATRSRAALAENLPSIEQIEAELANEILPGDEE